MLPPPPKKKPQTFKCSYLNILKYNDTRIFVRVSDVTYRSFKKKKEASYTSISFVLYAVYPSSFMSLTQLTDIIANKFRELTALLMLLQCSGGITLCDILTRISK